MKEDLTQEIKLIGNKKYKLELIVAIILALICSLAGASNLLFDANNLFPITADAMGHMTKVRYISECLAHGQIPSWFPYWYNGSTVTQYYPPLSYYIMVPIYWITNSILLTYKINCISMMFIGGMGVWTFCYKKIGRVCGLVGIIVYCWQPFLLISLYKLGVVAQNPIYGLTPWLLLLILSCAQKPTKSKFAFSSLLISLLILSHAMHAFIVCLCTMIILLLFVFFKKISFKNYVITGITIIISGLLTAFWSIVGVTGLENPGTPSVLLDSVHFYTANKEWFFNKNNVTELYFPFTILIVCMLALVLFINGILLKRHTNSHEYYVGFSIGITFFTVIFSFGYHIPFFEAIPLFKSLVPGRILSLSSVSSAICVAYVFYMFYFLASNSKILVHIYKGIAFCLVVSMIILLNPYQYTYLAGSLSNDASNTAQWFDKGRQGTQGGFSSHEVYVNYMKNTSSFEGWNIEGTPHSDTIWKHIIAHSANASYFLIKNFAFWNVRNISLRDDTKELGSTLVEQLHFSEVSDGEYISSLPSTYFLTDKRNSIVIGEGSVLVSIVFPYIIQGRSNRITDYSIEELSQYKFVYLYEIDVTTEKDLEYMESLITQLVNKGVKVVLEPKITENFNMFGVHVSDVPLESMPTLLVEQACPWKLDSGIGLNNNGLVKSVRSLYGLDKTYASFLQKTDGNVKNSVLGIKKVGSGEVIFVGARLSNYLEAVYINAWGSDMLNNKVLEDSKKVETIYEKIFDSLGVNKNFLPEAFDVTSSSWDYQGGSFTYNNETAQQITVSVTYAPRWTAKIDHKEEIKVDQCEHLITLDLPAGNHTVELHYGITIYGKIGYLISGIGLVVFILFIMFFNKIQIFLNRLGKFLKSYLQY